MSPALLIFWDVLDCACTLLRLAWRYARIVLTNVFLVHALFAYAACGRNMLTQVWYAFCCNVMLCIYHAIYFSTFVFRHSYVCTEVWSTHCWPVAIVPTGLQYFFCIGSKHNPQEFLTSRFPFSKARCGYIAVGNWDPHRAAVRPRRVGLRDKLLSNLAHHLSANYLWMMFCRLSSVGCLLFLFFCCLSVVYLVELYVFWVIRGNQKFPSPPSENSSFFWL